MRALLVVGAFVALAAAALQPDARTGSLQAAALVPAANRSVFVSIAYQYGAASLANYDRGTLTRLTAAGTPP